MDYDYRKGGAPRGHMGAAYDVSRPMYRPPYGHGPAYYPRINQPVGPPISRPPPPVPVSSSSCAQFKRPQYRQGYPPINLILLGCLMTIILRVRDCKRNSEIAKHSPGFMVGKQQMLGVSLLGTFVSGTGIKVAIKPEYRITPPLGILRRISDFYKSGGVSSQQLSRESKEAVALKHSSSTVMNMKSIIYSMSMTMEVRSAQDGADVNRS
eukprot:Gb_01534 [translate_table: standard]